MISLVGWLVKKLEQKIQKRLRGKNYDQSITRTLRKENKINDDFENKLSLLTIEELIALKLESSANLVKGKLYGFPIWSNINNIAKEAIIMFALSSTTSHKEAAAVLGLSKSQLKNYVRKYNLNEYLDR
tara:strand:- start:63 stop:449 length:387 start_codon:yes stop_codon:yes gene_type:complete